MARATLPIGILASLYWAISAPQVACADNLTEAKKSIQAMYAVKNTAAEKKDVQSMMSIYTPDFTITYPDGRVVNKTQLQQETEKMLPSVKSVVAHDLVKSISLKGNTAFVQSSRSSTSISDNPDTHKPDRVVLSAKVEDIWVKVEKKWLLKKSHVLAASFTANGKPIQAK
jgi:ketosteroid isomerase-like protein